MPTGCLPLSSDLLVHAPNLCTVRQVVSVGAVLTVRWMDGTIGTVDPEEAYVVNTEEEVRII